MPAWHCLHLGNSLSTFSNGCHPQADENCSKSNSQHCSHGAQSGQSNLQKNLWDFQTLASKGNQRTRLGKTGFLETTSNWSNLNVCKWQIIFGPGAQRLHVQSSPLGTKPHSSGMFWNCMVRDLIRSPGVDAQSLTNDSPRGIVIWGDASVVCQTPCTTLKLQPTGALLPSWSSKSIDWVEASHTCNSNNINVGSGLLPRCALGLPTVSSFERTFRIAKTKNVQQTRSRTEDGSNMIKPSSNSFVNTPFSTEITSTVKFTWGIVAQDAWNVKLPKEPCNSIEASTRLKSCCSLASMAATTEFSCRVAAEPKEQGVHSVAPPKLSSLNRFHDKHQGLCEIFIK